MKISKKQKKEFYEWLSLLENLVKLKINQHLIVRQKEYLEMFLNVDRQNDSVFKTSSKSLGLNPLKNIMAFKVIAFTDRMLTEMNSLEIDISLYETINDIIVFLAGLHTGIFDVASPKLTKYYKKIIDKYKSEYFNLEKQTKKKSQRNILKEDDEAFVMYMGFAKRIYLEKQSQYRVIKEFIVEQNKKNKTLYSEGSLKSGFKSFIRNHADKVKEKLNVDENQFRSTFYPKSKI